MEKTPIEVCGSDVVKPVRKDGLCYEGDYHGETWWDGRCVARVSELG